jgi:ribonuclease HI
MRVFTDASFKDGVAGLAAVLAHDGKVIYFSRSITCRGSNHAEYLAAIFGSEAAGLHADIQVGEVVTDSLLMSKQFRGSVKVRSHGLRDLLGRLKMVTGDVHWDPDHKLLREADALSKFVRRRPYASP